jgi:phage terminase Nu1 subunit (DNA packaging protein)
MKTLYSLNKITEMLEADRAVMQRAMRSVTKPDGYEGRQPRYTLKTAVNALVAHKLGIAKQQKPGSKQTDERQLLLREQRIARQRANEIEAGALVPAARVEAEWSDLLRSVRNAMLAIPARASQRCPHLSRLDLSEIDREIRAVLTEAGSAED